jgi:hypothetical protein
MLQVGREIDLSEIKICKRPDGSDWLLGAGSFGQVGCHLPGKLSRCDYALTCLRA